MRQPQRPEPIKVGDVLLDPVTLTPIFDARADKDPIAALKARAQEAGLKPGTPEYAAFMAEGGSKPPQTTVNVDTGGGKFEEAFAKGDATTISTVYDAGLAAQRNLGRIDQLDALLKSSPTGGLAALKLKAGEFGIPVDGLDDIQAAQALINSLVPEQRQPGSGPMSDADLALFKQSLPRIINQPGGNDTIIQTMRGIAQYAAEGARIVQQLRAGELTRDQAFAALQNRVNPLEGLRMPATPPAASSAEIPPAPEGVPPEDWEVMTPEERALWE
jgi:flagellar protein FlgJ